MEKYIVFDVETPNAKNDRISSIGAAVIENGKIVETYSSLVNPETYFSSFNIELTGINKQKVKNAPNFKSVWKELEPIFKGGILIAHNAAFDMGVLAKCIKSYNIEDVSSFSYACTVRMSRKCFPELENHKLNTVCDYLNIALDHHKADSDSVACAKIFIECVKRGMDPQDFIKIFEIN